MTTRIFIECTGYGQAGARYRVMTETGRVLIASSRVPAFDAARALLAEGVTGRLEVWRPQGTHPAMVLGIQRGAELTVLEGERQGPRFGAWKPACTTLSPAWKARRQGQTEAGMALEAHTSRQGRQFEVRG
jgi:hypothetical protein